MGGGPFGLLAGPMRPQMTPTISPMTTTTTTLRMLTVIVVVTIKTPACPVVVAPPAAGAAGEWKIEAEGNNVRAEFRSTDGDLLGFALTGDATRAKIELQKALPAILP